MYTRVNWRNGETGGTPLNADNLNQMDEGIKALDTEMLNKQNKLVAGENISIDEATNTISSTGGITEAEVDAKIAASEEVTDGKIAETEARLDDKITHRISANAVDTSFNLPTVEGGIKLNKVVGKSYKSKNLIQYKKLTTQTVQGITFTPIYVNGHLEKINVSGTSTGLSQYRITNDILYFDGSKDYIISGGTTNVKCMLWLFDTNKTFLYNRNSPQNALISDRNIAFYTGLVEVPSGVTVNADVYPMLNEGSTALPYEPYGMWSSGEMGCVKFKDLSWSYESSVSGFEARLSDIKNPINENSYPNVICDGFMIIPSSQRVTASGARLYVLSSYVCIRGVPYTDVDSFISAMGDTPLAYEVADGQTPNRYAEVVEETGKNLINMQFATMNTNKKNLWYYKASGILLKANTTYTFSIPNHIDNLYFKSMNGTTLANKTNASSVSYTPTSDTLVYLETYQPTDYTEILPAQLEIGSTPTEYQPYQSNTTIIPLSEPLRSVGDVKDEIDVENKQIIRRVRCRDDLSTLAFFTPSWWSRTDAKLYQVQIDDASLSSLIISKNFNAEVSFGSNRYLNYVVDIVTYPDVATFKSKLSSMGEEIIYELATPTTEPLTDEQIEALNSLVSFKGRTLIDTADVYAKATLDLDYPVDIIGYINDLLAPQTASVMSLSEPIEVDNEEES